MIVTPTNPSEQEMKARVMGITIVDSYQNLPVVGKAQDVFFCRDMDAVCKWVERVQDWRAMSVERFTDVYNDRRGAIAAQKAKKNE